MKTLLLISTSGLIHLLVSVRAYAVESRYQEKMHVYIDRWTRASNTFYNLNRYVMNPDND